MDTNDEFINEVNIHADMLPKMQGLYGFLSEHGTSLDYETMITLLQAAFWIGVEVGAGDSYQDFRNEIVNIKNR